MNIRQKRIGLLGATGMVGTGFARMVEISPHKLRTFLRSEFDILINSVDMLNLDGCDVVINLAGMTNRMMINSKTEASGDICNGVLIRRFGPANFIGDALSEKIGSVSISRSPLLR